MNGMSQGSLDPAIIKFGEFQVDLSEHSPILFPKSVNKSREIER
jgi:hypothetical protein